MILELLFCVEAPSSRTDYGVATTAPFYNQPPICPIRPIRSISPIRPIRPYPPINQVGIVDPHDRPFFEYGQLSKL